MISMLTGVDSGSYLGRVLIQVSAHLGRLMITLILLIMVLSGSFRFY